MKIPPANDPGWRGFNEHHERFMNEHADFEEDIMEEFQYLAELRERFADADSDAEATMEYSSTWKFVSEWYPLEDENFSVQVDSPFGEIKLTASWQEEASPSLSARTLKFSWEGIAGNPHQLLVVLLSSDTLLPLAEPLPLGSASVDGSVELPENIITDSTQSLAFRLMLSDTGIQAQLESNTFIQPNYNPTHRNFSPRERSALIEYYRRPSNKTRTPLVCRRDDKGEPQATPLQLLSAGGVADAFPPYQSLPPDWFHGKDVRLHFSDKTGVWQVSRSGTFQKLVLRFWSKDGQFLGEPLIVGPSGTNLPAEHPSQVALIEVEVEDDDHDT